MHTRIRNDLDLPSARLTSRDSRSSFLLFPCIRVHFRPLPSLLSSAAGGEYCLIRQYRRREGEFTPNAECRARCARDARRVFESGRKPSPGPARLRPIALRRHRARRGPGTRYWPDARGLVGRAAWSDRRPTCAKAARAPLRRRVVQFPPTCQKKSGRAARQTSRPPDRPGEDTRPGSGRSPARFLRGAHRRPGRTAFDAPGNSRRSRDRAAYPSNRAIRRP